MNGIPHICSSPVASSDSSCHSGFGSGMSQETNSSATESTTESSTEVSDSDSSDADYPTHLDWATCRDVIRRPGYTEGEGEWVERRSVVHPRVPRVPRPRLENATSYVKLQVDQ